ncbi:MAG: Asp23/Gls24 family envelope stress response protein, partial [Anaerolineales bacterium]
MDTETPRGGKITIAPDVLVTIAKLSALGVPGVARTSPIPGGVNRLFRRGAGEGVRIEVRDHAVRVDLYLVVNHDTNVREVSRRVQAEVARAIQEM